jgi:hypothetical protein
MGGAPLGRPPRGLGATWPGHCLGGGRMGAAGEVGGKDRSDSDGGVGLLEGPGHELIGAGPAGRAG